MKTDPKTSTSKKQAPVRKTKPPREAGPAQPSQPKSVYNPRGLKVADILARIHVAFEYDTRTPVDLTNSAAFRIRKPRVLSSVTGPIAEYSILSMGPKTVELKNLMDADQMAILPNDKALAKAIQQHPTLTLLSDEHADAIARWMYGKVHGVRKETRTAAKNHLRTAFPPKEGQPASFRGDLKLLRTAYDDLVAYGDGLRECILGEKNPDALEVHFPDCDELKSYYPQPPRSLVGKRLFRIPTGKQLAIKVFETQVGWSRTQIRNHLVSA